MGKRDDLVPEDFLEHLRLSVSGFRGEDERHQMAVASMLWTGTTKRRAHSHFENHFWFTYKEIGSEFGRGRFKVGLC